MEHPQDKLVHYQLCYRNYKLLFIYRPASKPPPHAEKELIIICSEIRQQNEANKAFTAYFIFLIRSALNHGLTASPSTREFI